MAGTPRCSSPKPLEALEGDIDWTSRPVSLMRSDEFVASQMSSQGWAHFGVFPLSDDTRLSATRYSAKAYKSMYLDRNAKELRMFPSYHLMDEERLEGSCLDTRRSLLKRKGNAEDRKTYLEDVRAIAVALSSDQHSVALKHFRDESGSTENLPPLPHSSLRRVAMGYAYDRTEQQADNPNSSFWFKRGFWYKAAGCDFGIISGRSNLEEPDTASTIEVAVIDPHVRRNFGTVSVPSDTSHEEQSQQGVLWLTNEFLRKPDGALGDDLWTLPYNDAFYLGGIHYQQPVYLASCRSAENVQRPNSKIGLRIFGREMAMLMGSGAYELHSSKALGEVFVYSGSANGAQFGFTQLPEVFERYSEDHGHRASLSWLSELGSLKAGDVVVQTMEKKVGDAWVSSRVLNSLP